MLDAPPPFMYGPGGPKPPLDDIIECDVPGRVGTPVMMVVCLTLLPKNWPSPSMFWSIFFHTGFSAGAASFLRKMVRELLPTQQRGPATANPPKTRENLLLLFIQSEKRNHRV
jgi:hypothetical protein